MELIKNGAYKGAFMEPRMELIVHGAYNGA